MRSTNPVMTTLEKDQRQHQATSLTGNSPTECLPSRRRSGQ